MEIGLTYLELEHSGKLRKICDCYDCSRLGGFTENDKYYLGIKIVWIMLGGK